MSTLKLRRIIALTRALFDAARECSPCLDEWIETESPTRQAFIRDAMTALRWFEEGLGDDRPLSDAEAVRVLAEAGINPVESLDRLMSTLTRAEASARLQAAIRAFTTDAKDADGKLIANGPAEQARLALDDALLALPPSAESMRIWGLATNAYALEVARLRELRLAAEEFFGGEFR